MKKNYKLDRQETMQETGRSPSDYGILHKSHNGCAVWSIFLFDMSQKIQLNGTPEQVKKYNELQRAYVDIVNDCSQVNRLECMIIHYQMKLEKVARENVALKKEVEKLTKTLEFQNE